MRVCVLVLVGSSSFVQNGIHELPKQCYNQNRSQQFITRGLYGVYCLCIWCDGVRECRYKHWSYERIDVFKTISAAEQ